MSCALHILLQKAYNAYKENLGDTELVLTYKEWYSEMMEASPLFYFWGTTLNLELLLLQFLKAHREGILQDATSCTSCIPTGFKEYHDICIRH